MRGTNVNKQGKVEKNQKVKEGEEISQLTFDPSDTL